MTQPSDVLRILEDPLADIGSLSPRERQVVRLAARGFKIDEIGERLGIKPKTVEFHLAQVKEKTGLSKSEMIRHLFDRIERVANG